MKEILYMEDPRFPDFLERLEDYLIDCENEIIEKATKEHRLPKGFITTDSEGNQIYKVSIPPEEKKKIVRKVLEETGDIIDVDGTIKFFQTIEIENGFRDCEDCKALLGLIRIDEGNA